MQTIPIRKRLTPAQRETILAAYRQSSLTQPEFALKHNIGVSTLRFWLRRSGSQTQSRDTTFLPVPNLLPQPGVSPDYRLQWPGGLILELRAGFNPQELATLLQWLPNA